jgi:hypothetical protein
MSVVGIVIGFYGYLFPGNINLMVLELYRQRRYALLAGATTVVLAFESLYCFATLRLLDEIQASLGWFRYLELAAYLLTIALGIWMFLEKKLEGKQFSGTLYRGILSAILHPQQIPFWLFMGILFHDSIFETVGAWSLPIFVCCNLIGTLLILSIYAYAGAMLMQRLRIEIKTLNKIAGIVYIAIGIVSLLGF